MVSQNPTTDRQQSAGPPPAAITASYAHVLDLALRLEFACEPPRIGAEAAKVIRILAAEVERLRARLRAVTDVAAVTHSQATADMAAGEYAMGFRHALEQAAMVSMHMGHAASHGLVRGFTGPGDQGAQTAYGILRITL